MTAMCMSVGLDSASAKTIPQFVGIMKLISILLMQNVIMAIHVPCQLTLDTVQRLNVRNVLSWFVLHVTRPLERFALLAVLILRLMALELVFVTQIISLSWRPYRQGQMDFGTGKLNHCNHANGIVRLRPLIATLARCLLLLVLCVLLATFWFQQIR